MEQKPSIGRIVHYRAHGSPDGSHKPAVRAAIITGTYQVASTSDTPADVDHHKVDLCVLNPTGMFFNVGCLFDGEKGGTWSWPPRV